MKYHLLALVIVAIWGTTFISTKVLILAGLHPAEIFFLRFSIAYIGMLVYHLSRHGMRVFSDSLKDELKLMLMGVTGGSMYFLTENTALQFTQTSNCSFLVSTAPLLTLLLTAAYSKYGRSFASSGLQKAEFTFNMLAGSLIALVGLAMVVFDGVHLKISPKGDLLSVCAALSWSFYSLFAVSMTKRYGSVFVTRKVFLYGIVSIVPFLVFGENAVMDDIRVLAEPVVGLNLIFLGAVASLMCFLGWNVVMSRLGQVTSSNYNYLNPFFTLVGAYVFLGESMGIVPAIGSVLIIAGVWLSRRQQKLRG